MGSRASIFVRIVMQLEVYVSWFVEYYGISLDRLTILVSVVVVGDFNDHRCRAEGLIVAKIAEVTFTDRWGLATIYAATFPQPMHYSAPAHEA